MIDTTFKIDIKKLIGPFDKKEEPKTLAEIQAEVGGFPFTARAVVAMHAPGVYTIPIGTELTLVGCSGRRDEDIRFVDDQRRYRVNPNIKRWILLGHK